MRKPSLEDIRERYDINLDNPTHEETLEQQEMADRILEEKYALRYELQQARDGLNTARNVVSDRQKAEWLKRRGYISVKVLGGVISFDEALGRGYASNIHRMYEREVGDLRKFLESNRAKLY